MPEVTFLPCAPEHIQLIKPQPGTELEKTNFLMPGFKYMIEDHFAMSAWVGHRCICAAGIVPIYDHRAVAWALVGHDAGPYMRQITRKVRAALDLSPYPRIEMQVNYNFEAGQRWAKMLGFQVEAERMRMAGIFGDDETLYVRIKE